jgi:hypothetical protein
MSITLPVILSVIPPTINQASDTVLRHFASFLKFRELLCAKSTSNRPKTNENRQICSKYLAKVRFFCKNSEIAAKPDPSKEGV